jgi:hypothetical protein
LQCFDHLQNLPGEVTKVSGSWLCVKGTLNM